MGTTLSTLSPPPGAKHKRKRKGRGPGSGNGTTAGKGQKGQKSRSGVALGAYFEGGQMPLQRRLPKRGFNPPFRVEYAPVNIGKLGEVFEAGAEVTVEAMRAGGLVAKRVARVKVLGGGNLEHGLTVQAHAFSKSALEKIQAAGGSAEVIPLSPGGKGRAE